MTPEEKSLLERTYKLAEENNAILHGLRRSARWSIVFKSIYWIVIIGLSVGALYTIQPYLNIMTGALGSITNLSGNFNTAGSAAESLKSLLNTK